MTNQTIFAKLQKDSSLNFNKGIVEAFLFPSESGKAWGIPYISFFCDGGNILNVWDKKIAAAFVLPELIKACSDYSNVSADNLQFIKYEFADYYYELDDDGIEKYKNNYFAISKLIDDFGPEGLEYTYLGEGVCALKCELECGHESGKSSFNL